MNNDVTSQCRAHRSSTDHREIVRLLSRSHQSAYAYSHLALLSRYNYGDFDNPIPVREQVNPMSRAHWWKTVAVVAALVLGPAPVGADFPVAGQSWSQDLPAAEIIMTEYAFGPSEPTIRPGATRLRIVNGGIRRHNVVVQIDGVELASPAARPGEVVEWDVTIDRPGRYLFWCGEYRHLEKGMAGTLLVESPS